MQESSLYDLTFFKLVILYLNIRVQFGEDGFFCLFRLLAYLASHEVGVQLRLNKTKPVLKLD